MSDESTINDRLKESEFKNPTRIRRDSLIIGQRPANTEHPDLTKYVGIANRDVKVMLESRAAALLEVNQMVQTGMITDEFQFKQEFERLVQQHQVRLRGYWL